jgi:hypothetical protein
MHYKLQISTDNMTQKNHGDHYIGTLQQQKIIRIWYLSHFI